MLRSSVSVNRVAIGSNRAETGAAAAIKTIAPLSFPLYLAKSASAFTLK
jgi:hypothetical protein